MGMGRRMERRMGLKDPALSWTLVTHACNPSYSRGRDQEDHGSKPAWANSFQDPILKKPITQKGWWSGSRCRPWVQAPVLQRQKIPDKGFFPVTYDQIWFLPDSLLSYNYDNYFHFWAFTMCQWLCCAFAFIISFSLSNNLCYRHYYSHVTEGRD
jgi:hypothetical protein